MDSNFLDFNKNIYSKNIRVAFVNKIRSEKKFDNINELVKQMHADCKKISRELNSDSKFNDIKLINNF